MMCKIVKPETQKNLLDNQVASQRVGYVGRNERTVRERTLRSTPISDSSLARSAGTQLH